MNLMQGDSIALVLSATSLVHAYVFGTEENKGDTETYQISHGTSASSGTFTITPTSKRTRRTFDGIWFRNDGGTTQTITVRLTLSGTIRPLITFTLATGESVQYSRFGGWVKIEADGDPAGSGGGVVSVFGSATNGLAPASGGGTTNFLRADGTWAVPTPADPWTYVKLVSNAVTTATAQSNTSLAFTPIANRDYVVESCMYVQSAVATTGVRPGISWPSGMTKNAAWAMSPISATALAERFWGGSGAADFVAATGTAVLNQDSLAMLSAIFTTGASPSGNFTITLSSEVAASEARIMAGSWLRYRTI